MPLNKKISIVILIIGFLLVGNYAWKNYINVGILAFQGEIPFGVQINDESLACSSDTCEKNVAPGQYSVKIQKVDYEDIEQTVEVKRGEKLVIGAKFKKKISFSEGTPINEKYQKLLNFALPLEFAYDADLQKSYDAIFQLIKDINGTKKSVVFQKHNDLLQMATIVFGEKNVYFLASNFKKPIDVSRVLPDGAKVAISPAESIVVFFDNSGKNQAIKSFGIDPKGNGHSNPSVVTYFTKPIAADYLSFSADGKFVFATDSASIYKIDLAAKTKENVADFNEEIYGMKPSNDGKLLLVETADLKSFVVNTETRTKRLVDLKNLRIDFAYWTSKNSIVLAYPASGENAVLNYEDAIKSIESGDQDTANSKAFTRIAEYFPETSNSNVVRDITTMTKFPSRMDFVEMNDLRRVMLLVDKNIYNLDFTVR
ncbi:MAG: hypothetical protein UT33_C0005G0166 [Candidatus Peregrinibacteria bacterium GW2011_GWC2_39_14]|nr:MAG: hypothetical protein US92_C0001G0167 [Candidatus Peregrinibacteria bacterium GW2011_GWA2_38_36]KKR07222.1 MAG: hypothetical protein UT33_C0005G0166 [Candidatus Peregrinibacteria bacterium GW2011_GWC2_39_14]